MKKLMLLGIFALVVFLGCSFFARDFYLEEQDFPEEGKGMLVLVLDSNGIPTRTIAPDKDDITMEANSFDIVLHCTTLTIPDIEVLNYAGSVYANHGLTPGTWTAAITAYDSVDPDLGDGDDRKVVGALGGVEGTVTSGIVIGAGDTIIFGDEGGEELSILPITGQGDLSLDLVWEEGIADPAVVDAYLIPNNLMSNYLDGIGDFTANKLSITVPDTAGNTAYYGDETQYGENSGAALEWYGYYGLFITVKDDTIPVSGVATSVRIVTGYESYGYIDLQETTGTLELRWDLDLQTPVTIVFTETSTPTVGTTETLTITPTVTYPTDSSSVVDYYSQWFVDGVSTGAPSSAGTVEYTINGADYVGNEGTHQLSLLIYGLTTVDDLSTISTISSESIAFAVE